MKNLFVAGVIVAAGFLLSGCNEDEKTNDSCEQTTGGGGDARCQAMPVCDDNYVQVETCSDGAECVDVELCGVKITCEVAFVDDEGPGPSGGSGGADGSGGDAPTSGAGGSGGSGD